MKLFSSDWHIGHPRANYDAITKFLRLAKDAEELYLLGDTFELIWATPEGVAQEHQRWVTWLDSFGDRLKLYSGNHDPGAKLKTLFPGREIIATMTLDGWLLCHGDMFDLSIKALNTLAGRLYRYLPYLRDRLLTPFQEKVGERESFNLHIGQIMGTVFRYCERVYIAELTPPRVGNLKGVIFGHTHYPLDATNLSHRIINTGDMVDSLSYCIMENGRLELRKL